METSFVVPSLNADLKSYEILRDNEAYRSREALLRELFQKYGNKATQYDVYEELQGVDQSLHVPLKRKAFEELENLAEKLPDKWKHYSSDSGYDCWWKFSAEYVDSKAPHLNEMGMIKVYISVDDISRIPETYYAAVSLLLENSDNGFYSKVSTMKRTDSMCFWVSRHGFDLLENHFKDNSHVVGGALPFVAYRGKLGISRELASFDSHNGIQAELISSYFHGLENADQVDMGEMYKLLVKAWNRELPEDHPVMRAFRFSKAQMILILLDTMDIITSRTRLSDDHLFLQENGCLWKALGEVNREEWDQLERHYQHAVEWEKGLAKWRK